MSHKTFDELIAYLARSLQAEHVEVISEMLTPMCQAERFVFGTERALPRDVIPHVSLLTGRSHLRKVTGYSFSARRLIGSPKPFDLTERLQRKAQGYKGRVDLLIRETIAPALHEHDAPSSTGIEDHLERMIEALNFGKSATPEVGLAQDNFRRLLLAWILCMQVQEHLPGHAQALTEVVSAACNGHIPLGFGATTPNILLVTCA